MLIKVGVSHTVDTCAHWLLTFDKCACFQRGDGDDSAYSTRPASASTAGHINNIEGEEADNRQVKPWLRCVTSANDY